MRRRWRNCGPSMPSGTPRDDDGIIDLSGDEDEEYPDTEEDGGDEPDEKEDDDDFFDDVDLDDADNS